MLCRFPFLRCCQFSQMNLGHELFLPRRSVAFDAERKLKRIRVHSLLLEPLPPLDQKTQSLSPCPWAEPLPVAVTPSPARRKPGEGQPGSPRALIPCTEFGEIIKHKSLAQLLWHKGKAIKWPFLFQPFIAQTLFFNETPFLGCYRLAAPSLWDFVSSKPQDSQQSATGQGCSCCGKGASWKLHFPSSSDFCFALVLGRKRTFPTRPQTNYLGALRGGILRVRFLCLLTETF